MEFFSSAPGKAILFGEHYVVYGSQALSIPIEPRNIVKFLSGSGSGARLVSSIGEACISESCEFSGEQQLANFAEVARAVFGKRKIPPFTAEFLPSFPLKGVGSSSSLSAAFAAGLYKLSKKRASQEKIFLAAQSGDLVAHQGKASGIDAKTVSLGKPIVFQRKFSPPSYMAKPAKFSLPKGACLLLIDTYAGKRGSTAATLASFALSFSITTLPQLASEEKREEVRQEFLPIWGRVFSCKTPQEMGKLMDDNQLLLRMRRVSSPGIDKAVSAALSFGAYGAKLTGGGGEGGAVLALVEEKNSDSAMRAITDSCGFPCRKIEIAKKGARIG